MKSQRKSKTVKRNTDIYFWVWQDKAGDTSVSNVYPSYQAAVEGANECAAEMDNRNNDTENWYIVKAVACGHTTPEIQFEIQ